MFLTRPRETPQARLPQESTEINRFCPVRGARVVAMSMLVDATSSRSRRSNTYADFRRSVDTDTE